MCPDENILAAWIENNLKEPELKEFEAHLNSCPDCFEKAFFLKKALMREPLFLEDKKDAGFVQKAVLFIENQNIKIRSLLGNVRLRPLELAFRNQSLKKNAVLIELGNIRARLEKTGEEIVLSLEQEGMIQVRNARKRVVFSGRLGTGAFVYLESGQNYFLKSEDEEIFLELKNV